VFVTLALAGFTSSTLMVLAPAAQANQSFGLSYAGGPVLHSSSPYLVFWFPPSESLPANSRSLLEHFFTDVAADSGKSSNVLGVLRQYHDRAGFADYRQTFDPARQAIVDSQHYPPRDAANCPRVGSAYPTCISDGQVQSELKRLITAKGLRTSGPSGGEPSPNAPVYFVVLPADVNVCTTLLAEGGFAQQVACADNVLCGYHGSFLDVRGGFNTVLYAAIPVAPHRDGSLEPDPKRDCQTDGTSAVQEPNHDAADVVISELSHELSETITDPILDKAWFDTGTGNESGDACGATGAFDPATGNNPNGYLPTLGGSATAGTLYDQLINGHPYYLQSEWSNGDGNCEMRPSPGSIAARFTIPRRANKARPSLTFSPAASTSKNALSSATWNFGDGSRTSFYYGKTALMRANHRFRAAGSYTITLTLVDNRGNLQTTARRVTIQARKRHD
jgi:hypothetical protein